MSKIFLTGGTGFIGAALANRLSQNGHDLIISGVQTENTPKATIILEPGLIGIDWTRLNNIDVLFHLSANNDTTCTDREEMLHANYHSAITLFNNCLNRGCKHFIFASSTAVYGNEMAPYVEDVTPIKPLNVYGESKAKLEEYALHWADQHKVNMIGLRYCNVFGPGEAHKRKRASMIYQMAKQFADGHSPKLFKWGEQSRDFVFIDDVVDANLAAMSSNTINDVFNVGSGTSARFVPDLFYWLNEEHFKTKFTGPEFIDNPSPGTYQTWTQCDLTKISNTLGFKPKYSIKRGTMKYMEECFPQKK